MEKILKKRTLQLGMDALDVLSREDAIYQRTQTQRKSLIDTIPHVCIERARIVTEVYKKTENLHILTRRARAFEEVLKQMSIFILDGELIAGHQSSMRRSAPLFPEFAVEWIKDEIDLFDSRPQDKFVFPEQAKKEFLEEIYPYWKGRTLEDNVFQYMTEDIRALRFDSSVFTLGIHESGGLGHLMFDYNKVLTLGFDGIKKQIRGHMEALKPYEPDSMKKRLFYESCLTICDAVIAFARRYSVLAREMAESETDEKRKQELMTISENCARVPELPARNFYEALQSFWFVQIIPQIYDNGVSISPGRFDQYMYPFYERDISDGKLSKKEAQGLLEAIWIKFTEPIKLYNKADAAFFAGYPMGQNLIVGGQDELGYDATNDLSYRCLEAHRHILLAQPNFSVRLHNRSPQEFKIKVIETVKCGSGMPQMVSDEIFIPSLMKLGVTLKEARNYALIGCVEAAPLHTWGRYNGGYINLVKMVELALTNGQCLISGKKVSVSSGDATHFESFEDVLEAYRKQVEYCTQRLVTWNNYVDMVHEEYMPTPFTSMLIDDCISQGKDVTSGGARYNWTGPSGIGIANAGDALYAVKRAVFDEKIMTMEELVDMMKADFADNEDTRLFLWNKIDKYGNDKSEVDDITKLAVDMFLDELEKYSCYRNGPFVASLLPVSSYVAFGWMTGASPDGRHAREPIADGISPQNGVDVNGPTAAAKSVAHIDHVRCANGIIFNQKYNAETLKGEGADKKMMDYITTYNALGGAHIQLNVIDSDVLRDAKENPDKYKGLVVRVAGYSAFFNELAEEIQDSIIERTEHQI